MNKQKGSITVEAALGLPILIMAVLTWVEVCVFTYSTALTDHALTIGVMKIKKQGNLYQSTKVDYERLLTAELKNSGARFGMLSPSKARCNLPFNTCRVIESWWIAACYPQMSVKTVPVEKGTPATNLSRSTN